MKNNSLNILKLILICLFGFGLFMACEKEDTEVNKTNPSLPQGGSEVPVKLLIKGEAIIPPSSRAMNPGTEGSYQDSLQLLILAEKDGVFYYNTHRPVDGTEGNFSVRVPIRLDGTKLKFLLFSNSKGIIGNPDEKFTTTTTESEIRSQLTLTVGTQWDSNRKIPMWAEDVFTFHVPKAGTPPDAVANLKLMRMLARIDVGVKYNGYELGSAAEGLTHFKLQQIKVHHSKDKGQLMPGADAYTTTGTGTGKKIEINTPSIPSGGANISPYGISVTEGSPHACEREIYLFEQKIISDKAFDVSRTCILVQGEYKVGSVVKTGWYRLDFRGFRKTAADAAGGYADILRNMLYRFNITAVKGPGFATEGDALNSVSSNITVELIPLELNQNDIIFDGQSYLSVNKSELYFYRNKNKASFSLSTDYWKGWAITGTGSDVTATPGSGGKGSAVAELTWSPLPTEAAEKEIYLTAGNLKKKIILKFVAGNAPGNLASFSLSPSVLYFIKEGARGVVNVTSNITEKYLSQIAGKLSFTIPASTSGESFDVTVDRFAGTSAADVESGAVEVSVKAANADITGQCNIRQLTYEKELACTPGLMPHGLGGKAAVLDVEYVTKEKPGTYWISFLPTPNGNPSDSKPSGPNSDLGGKWAVRVTAQPNKTSVRQRVGTLRFAAALNGEEIPLLGYHPEEVEIFQEPAPPPTVSIETGKTTLPWNHPTHSFTVRVDNHDFLADGPKTVTITTPGSPKIATDIPSSGTVDETVNFSMGPNRGDNPKTKIVEVSVQGHGGQTATDRVTYTQEVAEEPKKEPSMGYNVELPADRTSFGLDISGLSNIFEVKITDLNAVDGSGKLIIDTPPSTFTINAKDSTRASATFSINANTGHSPLKVQVVVKALGNRESQFFTRHYTVTQKGAGRPGSLSVTPASLTKDPEGGTYNNAIAVSHSNMTTLTAFSADSWISPSLVLGPPGLISFTLAKNTGYARRSGAITITGTAEDGNTLTERVTITQTAYLQGLIIVPPRGDKLSMWGNDSPSPGRPGKSEHFEGTFTLENMPADAPLSITASDTWIRDLKVEKGKYLFKLSNNVGGKERTGTIIISGQDKTGNTVRGTVQVTQKWGTSLNLPNKIKLIDGSVSVQIGLVNTTDFNLKASIGEDAYSEKIILENRAKTVYLSLSPKAIGNTKTDFGTTSSFTLRHILSTPPKSFNLAIFYIDSDGNEQYKQIQVN